MLMPIIIYVIFYLYIWSGKGCKDLTSFFHNTSVVCFPINLILHICYISCKNQKIYIYLPIEGANNFFIALINLHPFQLCFDHQVFPLMSGKTCQPIICALIIHLFRDKSIKNMDIFQMLYPKWKYRS